jgi:hypothetical protein
VRQCSGVYCPLGVIQGRNKWRDSWKAHHPQAVAALIARVRAFCVEGTRRHRRQPVATVLTGGVGVIGISSI